MQSIPSTGEELTDFLRGLPKEPGIYKFLSARKLPIYIGKAKNLRKRVPSYFRDSKNKSQKLENLRREACYLEITLTKNELESLLLEQHLIKENRPKFKVQFKDDKGYPWIKIDTSKDFPSAKSYLGKKNDKERYFGPYPNSYAVRDALSLIQKTFKIRNCTDNFFKNRARPCMQYQIGRCSAPCTQNITKEDYINEVEGAVKLLEGKSEDLITELYSSMDLYSKNQFYERAAIYRDKISSLRDVQRNQSITGYTKERDALSISSLNGLTKVGITHVNEGWITGHENFVLKSENIEGSLLENFIKSHYLSSIHCPEIIILKEPILEKATIEAALSKFHDKKVKITTKPGKKDKGLLEISLSNTIMACTKSFKNRKDTSLVLYSLKEQLGLKEEINLIESYDISHHAGSGAVGGCVVYSKEGKLKDKYRLFNIAPENSKNDIASMEEVIKRRFTNQTLGLEKPNLIIIDGGKTHLNAVSKILNNLAVRNIDVISISKGARRKAEFDSIHKIDGSTIEVIKGSLSHLFIQEIRDETHRFSITNQKKNQSKLSMKSSLDDLEGVGLKRKKLLLRYFGSLDQIERAGIQDLLNVNGIGQKTAYLIYNHLH
jgi:excinuclease ABC subunit C